MAKTPHIDFALRETLDGTEELYSQNGGWEPAEQKFTVAQLAAHILAQMPAAGEVNTASNAGAGGIGVYDGKDGVDLQFRNLISLSDKLTLTLSGNNIQFDLDEAALNPPMIFTDLTDIPNPSADTMMYFDGTAYQWIDRAPAVAKNVGTSGVGVFDGKNNFEFDFRNIAAASNKVTVSLSGKNIEVDVDAGLIASEMLFSDLGDIVGPTTADTILHWNGTNYDWIAAPSGGTAPDASNGLTLNTDYELGGTLTKSTLIDAFMHEFEVKHKAVSLKAFAVNPFWAPGDESFFLHTANPTQDTETIVGVTDENGSGGIAQIWSRKPNTGTYAYMFQTPGNTNFRSFHGSYNHRTEMTIAYNGVFMNMYDSNSTTEVGTINISQDVSQFKRTKSGATVNLRIQEQTNSSKILEVLFEGLPVYADIAAAQADNYPANGLFQTPTGAVFVTPA